MIEKSSLCSGHFILPTFGSLTIQAGKEFDRFVSKQMFDKADSDYDRKITSDEFSSTFIEAERKLIEKVELFETKRDDSYVKFSRLALIKQLKREEIEKRIVQQQATAKNQPRQKMLVFKVNDMMGIPTKFNTFFDFQVSRTTSGLININDFQKEEYVMELDDDDDELTIYVNPKAESTSYDGRVSIPLAMIADGEKHDKYFEIQDMISSTGEKASIAVQLQLVYSHVNLEIIQSKIFSLSTTASFARLTMEKFFSTTTT